MGKLNTLDEELTRGLEAAAIDLAKRARPQVVHNLNASDLNASHLTPAQDKLNEVGIYKLCERIEAGESYRDLAESLGIAVSNIHAYLCLPHHLELSTKARKDSAEAWLDKGLAVITSSLLKSGDIDPAAARAYAHECARRAGVRNPVYKDKAQVDLHVKVSRSEAEIESRIIELSAEAGIIGVIGSEAEDTEHQQIPHVLP